MMSKCLYCYLELEGEDNFHNQCALDFFGSKQTPKIEYTIDQMSELAKTVVERSVTVPGVQAKLSMSLISDSRDNSDNRLTVVGALGGNYILKPPSLDYPEMPQNEHLTMRMAEAFGIRVVPSCLIPLASGELSYITKRIDRDAKGNKIHMLDMFQITEAFDKYKGSMEKIGKALGEYSSNPFLDKVFLFELTLFSFLSGNNDMHLKNFSMIESESGWLLAPAYDLLNVSVLLPEDNEELALTLRGKKNKLNRKHFEEYAKNLGLTDKQIKAVFNRFLKLYKEGERLIGTSFLSADMKSKYRELLNARYQRIYGEFFTF